MMSNPWLFGKIEDGKVMLSDINLYHGLVHELEGKRIQIKIEELNLKYTDRQLNTYFGILIGKYVMNISDFAGWTKDEIDNYFGSKFRTEYKSVRGLNNESDKMIHQIIPITKLSRKQFSKFIEEVILYLNENYQLDIVIETEK